MIKHFRLKTRHLSILIVGLVLGGLGLFQNCGQVAMTSASGKGLNYKSASADPRAQLSTFSKIAYDQNIASGESRGPLWFRDESGLWNPPRVDVDLETESLAITSADKVVSCRVDASRLAELKNIFATARVCHPAPLPEGAVTCMAMAMPDLELSNASDDQKISLAAPMCNSGTWLCDGVDEDFRALLIDLRDHPPVECAAAP